MKSGKFKLIFALSLAMTLALMPINQPLAVGESTTATREQGAGISSKEEVIYATLSPQGDVSAIYAVNHFALAGEGSITDYGNYASVTNLTDTTPLVLKDDAVVLEAAGDNFYYKGDLLTTDLPWLFDISYFLGDVQKEPGELAGESGELSIQILTKQNESVNTAFFDNYMLQISLTLATEKCSSIQASGATIANAGKNKVITYTVMPGQEATLFLRATVKDFTMGGIDIAALPFSVEMALPDTGALANDFTKLSAAIADLDQGMGELAGGLVGLKAGAAELGNGSADLKSGLTRLNESSGPLVEGSSQIGSALTRFATALNDSPGEMNLNDLARLPQGLSELAAGLDEIAGSMIELKNGFTPSYQALDRAMAEIPETVLNEEQLGALYAQIDPSHHQVLDQLVASYETGQRVKSTYSQVKGAFDGVDSALNLLPASIDTISSSLEDLSAQIGKALSGADSPQQLDRLAETLGELSRNYEAFHNGLREYTEGVAVISAGYSDFHDGFSTMEEGIGRLEEGATALYGGTSMLNGKTANMPDRLESEIGNMLEQYTGLKFAPISFTSSKNRDTTLVQFVLKCGGIEKPEEAKTLEVKTDEKTFWSRLVALFTDKKKR